MLAIFVAWKLCTRSIDFVQACVQAEINTDMCMEILWRFDQNDGVYVLKLKSNFCSLCDAGLMWFEYLKKGLIAQGFRQSNLDPCLFLKKDMIVIVHVGNCLIFGLNEDAVNDFLKSLERSKPGEEYPHEDRGFNFTIDRDANTFLDVIVKKEGDTIKMTQPLLIKRILDTLNFSKVTMNSKPTPSIYVLHKDKNGEARKNLWNYRSLIRMLNYLTNTTRPDISMAVH